MHGIKRGLFLSVAWPGFSLVNGAFGSWEWGHFLLRDAKIHGGLQRMRPGVRVNNGSIGAIATFRARPMDVNGHPGCFNSGIASALNTGVKHKP